MKVSISEAKSEARYSEIVQPSNIRFTYLERKGSKRFEELVPPFRCRDFFNDLWWQGPETPVYGHEIKKRLTGRSRVLYVAVISDYKLEYPEMLKVDKSALGIEYIGENVENPCYHVYKLKVKNQFWLSYQTAVLKEMMYKARGQAVPFNDNIVKALNTPNSVLEEVRQLKAGKIAEIFRSISCCHNAGIVGFEVWRKKIGASSKSKLDSII